MGGAYTASPATREPPLQPGLVVLRRGLTPRSYRECVRPPGLRAPARSAPREHLAISFNSIPHHRRRGAHPLRGSEARSRHVPKRLTFGFTVLRTKDRRPESSRRIRPIALRRRLRSERPHVGDLGLGYQFNKEVASGSRSRRDAHVRAACVVAPRSRRSIDLRAGQCTTTQVHERSELLCVGAHVKLGSSCDPTRTLLRLALTGRRSTSMDPEGERTVTRADGMATRDAVRATGSSDVGCRACRARLRVRKGATRSRPMSR